MKVSFVVLAAAAAVLAQDSVSATGAACEPHDDHWHCPPGVQEPTTPPGSAPTEAPGVVSSSSAPAAPAESCEPHGDHWHCPDGVPEPTTPPPAEAATTAAPTASESHDEHEHEHEHEATATTCEPHGDHYHCPSGVAEPTTPPPASSATSAPAATSASNATASASPSASPSQFDGAAAGISTTSGSFIAVIMGAVGAFFL